MIAVMTSGLYGYASSSKKMSRRHTTRRLLLKKKLNNTKKDDCWIKMMTFSEFLKEAEEIANDDIYLANMSKSFSDKAWFLNKLPKDITTIVDFGGGAGEFAEYCKRKMPKKDFTFIIIDNNESFLTTAKSKGFKGFTSLD